MDVRHLRLNVLSLTLAAVGWIGAMMVALNVP
jgi:hypothetical protein